jgi:hypothetical protein
MRFLGIGLVLAIVLAFFFWPRDGSTDPVVKPASDGATVSMPAADPATDAAAPPAFEPLRRDEAGALVPTRDSQPAAPSAAAQHEILVLDQDRKPVAGMPYAGTHDLNSRLPLFTDGHETDAAGRGLVPVLEPGDLRSYFVRLGFHGAEPVGAPLPAAIDGTLPVEILLPPYGSIRVEAAPELADSGWVSISLDGGERRFRSMMGGRTELVAGVARLSFIGLDQQWTVSIHGEEGSIERRVTGPTTAGEEIVVRFEAGADCILTGVLLNEDGRPLADTKFHSALLGENSNAGRRLTTDAEGRFSRVLTERDLQAAPTLLEIHRTLPNRRGFNTDEADPSSFARAALPQPLPQAEVDLGALRFEPAPILAAGVVRDQDGNPVADASLVVEELQHVTRAGEEIWNNMSDLMRARSAADGRFAIYGEKLAWDIRIRTHASDYLPEPPILVAYGTTGVEIVLEEGGSLEGVVKWPAGGELSQLEFSLESGTTVVKTSGGSIDGDTFSMKVKAAPSGTYALVGRIEQTEQEFLRLEGIVISAGEESTDPRLQPLDLSPYLGVVAVAPRAPDGTLPSHCMILRLHKDGGGGTNIRSPDGVHRMPVLHGGTADLLVECSGFRSIYLPQASGTLNPQLEPIFSVVISIGGEGPLANEHGAFAIQAEPSADADWPNVLLNRAKSQTNLTAERQARISALVLGSWDLSLLVPRMNSRGDVHPVAVSLGRIEIGVGDANRVFTLDLPDSLR